MVALGHSYGFVLFLNFFIHVLDSQVVLGFIMLSYTVTGFLQDLIKLLRKAFPESKRVGKSK